MLVDQLEAETLEQQKLDVDKELGKIDEKASYRA
jgi:hypothetical protein